jgi:hypothetical protein
MENHVYLFGAKKPGVKGPEFTREQLQEIRKSLQKYNIISGQKKTR